MSTDRKTYVPPELEALGTPAEIVQVIKILPEADGQGFTQVGTVPAESAS